MSIVAISDTTAIGDATACAKHKQFKPSGARDRRGFQQLWLRANKRQCRLAVPFD